MSLRIGENLPGRGTALAVATALALAAHAAGCDRSTPPNPEAARARGDALVRQMSDTLAKAQSISFETNELHERVRRNGQKASATFTRRVTLRRPDRMTFQQTGAEHDVTMYYDGKALTIVGDRQRIFARADVPGTLDAMFDRLSDRYDMPMPTADLLHSSAYDALIGEGTTGGWVGRGEIDGRRCEQVAYTHAAVDFTLHVSSSEPILPCRIEITDKKTPAKPITRVTFSNWNLSAPVDEARFRATIPAGYEEIPIVERIPRTELSKYAPEAPKAPTAKPAAAKR